MNEKDFEWKVKELHKYKSITNAERKFKELMQKEKPEELHKIITIEKEGVAIKRRIYAKKK